MDLSPSAAPGTGPFFGDRRLLAGERSAENMDLSPSQQIAILLARADLGRHLVRPWSVVLAGPVNVGKSSLINALAGYGRSIVHHAPGTTRDAVTAATAIDGWPVELCDTAGLRPAATPVERAGIERAQERLAQADLAVLVFDRERALVGRRSGARGPVARRHCWSTTSAICRPRRTIGQRGY